MTKTEPTMPIRANGAEGLVGLYFHTFVKTDDGCWVSQWQGHIDSLVNENTLLVTLFDWFVGAPNSTQFLPVEDLITGKAEFYDNAEDWRNGPKYGGGHFLSSRRHWDRDHVKYAAAATPTSQVSEEPAATAAASE